MGLPAAAKKQIEAAERLHKEVYNPDPPKEEPAEGSPAEKSASAGDGGSEPAKEPVSAENGQKPAQEGGSEPAQTPSQSQEHQVAPPAPAPEETFEHKYKVLQGKYNAEIPRMQGQIRQLESLLAKAQETPKPPPEPAKPTPEQIKKYLTEEEVDDYGTEMIDVVKRAAQEALLPQIQKLERENTELKHQLGGVSQSVVQTARERMFSQLDAALPNWREVNRDPAFMEWLQQPDVYSGVQRHQMMMQHFERNDADRVRAFFDGYLRENAVVAPTAPAAPSSPAQPKVDPNTLVAPGRPSEGSTPRAQPEKRQWTQAQIRQFYTDARNGRFRGKESEKLKIERDIIAATTEGRIVA